jgi:hypothetical protein
MSDTAVTTLHDTLADLIEQSEAKAETQRPYKLELKGGRTVYSLAVGNQAALAAIAKRELGAACKPVSSGDMLAAMIAEQKKAAKPAPPEQPAAPAKGKK